MVSLQLSESDMTFVATDAHKLVRYRRTDVNASNASSLLSLKPMNLLEGILQNIEGMLKLNLMNLMLVFLL